MYTFVCVHPIGRGGAPLGRVPLTVSTYRATLSFELPGAGEEPGPVPSTGCGFVEMVSCDVCTGIWTNEPVSFDFVFTSTLKLTIPVG